MHDLKGLFAHCLGCTQKKYHQPNRGGHISALRGQGMADDLLTVLFGSNDPTEQQRQILLELMGEKQQELAELDGVDSPAAAERREQLNEQIKQIDAQCQQIEAVRERNQTMDYQAPDHFMD